MKTVLLIVDVQNDFAQPNGTLYVKDGFAIVPIINGLRDKAKFDMVVLTQDYHPPGHISFCSSHGQNPDAKLFQPLDLGEGKLQMMWPDHCVQVGK
jgi:nicotinamidase/pyrazinamidase